MSRRLASKIALFSVLAAAGSVACESPQSAAAPASGPAAAPAPGAAAPPEVRIFKKPEAATTFSVQTIKGQRLSTADFKGKVTIVNFWATWCGPCKAEIPDLVALQERYRDYVQVIGISEDEDAPDVVQRFADERKVNYPIAMSNDDIRKIFPGVVALPTTFILDKDGHLVQKHIGMLNKAMTEHEARAIAGLETKANVLVVEPDQPVGLANAAEAKEIPGVDLKPLSAAKRVEVLQRLNKEGCTCGCDLTIAKCRIDDPACGVSLPIARRIVKEMTEGLPASR